MVCRRIYFCALYAGFVWLSVLHGEGAICQSLPSQLSSRLDLPPVTEAELAVFRDSLRSGSSFSPLNPEVYEEADQSAVGMWAGSRAKVEWGITSVVLRFAPKVVVSSEFKEGAKDSSIALLPSFDVQISLNGRSFELRHGAGDQRSGGGFALSLDRPGRARPHFVGGEQGSGLYAAIPAVADHERGWGALVCPRSVSQVRRDRTTAPVLLPSLYELSEAKVLASVRADARFSTGGTEGRSRVSVAVTGGLPTPNPDFDQAASALPQVDLFYNAQSKMPFFSLAGLLGRQEAVRMMVEMQNAAGYVRRQYFLQAIAIHRLDEPVTGAVLVDNRDVESDEGECYAVIVRRNRWSVYGREKPLF